MLEFDRIQKKLTAIMQMQEDLNRLYAGEDWAQARHPWHKYIRYEAGELIGHHNEVFHYRGGEPDWQNIETELVDILHFLASWKIQEASEFKYDSYDHAETHFIAETDRSVDDIEEDLALACINEDLSLTTDCFYALVARLGFDLEHLLDRYQLKYTLNKFRIGNGSLNGQYRKIWADGREDNEHLAELADQHKNETTGYDLAAIHKGLSDRYARVTTASWMNK